MNSTLLFVSGNEGKIAEAQAILNIPLDIARLDLEEIQDLNIETIVRKKAESAFAILQRPLVVDDVGLYVEAWNGFPGPFIKYIIISGGNDLLLQMLEHEKNRTITARAAIGYHDGTEIHTFIGEVTGSVATEKRGENAFGWDPIFIPESESRTFGEMSRDEKNAISHRRQALNKLKRYFKENNLYTSTK